MPGLNSVDQNYEQTRILARHAVEYDKQLLHYRTQGYDADTIEEASTQAIMSSTIFFERLPSLPPRQQLEILHDMSGGYKTATAFTRVMDSTMEQLRLAHPELPKFIGYIAPHSGPRIPANTTRGLISGP